MSLDATTALEDYVCFSCQVAKTSAWITNGWILFRVSDNSDCNWFMEADDVVTPNYYEVVASGTGAVTHFAAGSAYSRVSAGFPTGCTIVTYTLYDASGYAYTGTTLTLSPTTGELVVNRNAIYSYWLRIRVQNSDGTYFKNTNWFRIYTTCASAS